ncbi:AMP-dependent synthetase/ligase [Nocardia cyriacigeorgica]|uniref:AMP-dependent synthetase/ligase n=1 Tax=Nocardia cyriacigeorgica TaxID=135487 RepID=UPI0024551670|nr:long-chain fatty acid--CoA ligase [Nocardia cyriacigeorgica]
MSARIESLGQYNTSSAEQLAYVLDHSGARIIFCDQTMLDTAAGGCGRLEHVVSIDGPDSRADLTLATLESTASPGFDFETAWRAVRPEDTATLIYTSGTTGDPKGVPISHSNIVSAAHAVNEVVPMYFGDRITSFLPAAHIADRMSTIYWMAIHGLQVTYVEDSKTILAALVDTRPTLWFAVPRIWEKFRAALESKVDSEPDAQEQDALRRAIEFGRQRARAQQAGIEPPAVSSAQRNLFETILGRLRATLGLDHNRVSICGSAPIAPDTLEFFAAIGITVIEVWGMTETTGIGTINPPRAARLGTVGTVLPGNEIRLGDDGELLIRGPVCCTGYRDAAELTTESIDSDGWVHTGDIARIDPDGYVWIVDRKKEIMINAGGKNMSPANIENTIKSACPLIASIAVIGDAKPYNTALVTLDPEVATATARRLGVPTRSIEALAQDPRISEIVAAGIDKGNSALSRVEQIKRHRILDVVWEPGGDELTPTMKLRRKQIANKYADLIAGLYGQSDDHPGTG